jgi:hypothetical protein
MSLNPFSRKEERGRRNEEGFIEEGFIEEGGRSHY